MPPGLMTPGCFVRGFVYLTGRSGKSSCGEAKRWLDRAVKVASRLSSIEDDDFRFHPRTVAPRGHFVAAERRGPWPGKPQQDGRHERFHLTLKQRTASPPKGNALEQQLAFDSFRHEYNDLRPHEALSQTPPARHYEPSLRSMSEPQAPDYDPDMMVRWVSANGTIHVKGNSLSVGRLLANQPVALRQRDADEWELFYGPVRLAHVLIRKGVARLEALD